MMSIGYNLKYIVYRKYFRVDRKPIFVKIVRPARKWLILWITLRSKGKAYFFLQYITRSGTSPYMPLVVILTLS